MTLEKQGKIISNILWVGSVAVGCIAAEKTYNLGKKIVEKIYVYKYTK